MNDDVLLGLRERTRLAHERLERRMAVFDAMAAPGAARRLAPLYFDFHASAEAVLQDRLGAVPGLEFERRRRAPLIAAELERMGQPRPAIRTPTPPPRSLPEALGFLYVLDGSSLGGRVIRREAERRGLDLAGLSFLDPYGSEAGAMWRRFVQVLSRHCDEADARSRAAAGAAAGFAHAEATLCPMEAAA
jgi:heme oxygenase